MSQKTLHIGVAGGGSWGTALAHVLGTRGHAVRLFLRDAALAQTINQTHENTRYLPGRTLDNNVCACTDFSAIALQDVLVLAIPAQQLRSFLTQIEPFIPQHAILVNTAKGLECQSGKSMQQVVAEVLAHKIPRYAIVSGPSFAAEVLENQPTAVVLGCEDAILAQTLRNLFSTPTFRCYSSQDVRGVELGGALKNIMAIATGLCDGLGYGYNTRAALLTRGLAEICRFGTAMGAQAATFMGLSGLGDLSLTCAGNLSRNRQVGLRLGQGECLDDIISSLGMVAEGVKTTQAVYEMTLSLEVPAPITHAMYSILYAGQTPKDCVFDLMTRTLKDE